jgi:cation:H+ antiporter
VEFAVMLADREGMPRPLVGLLLLATLTSLPNAATAIRLGLRGRGEALVSESLNSNTINLSMGVLVPAALVGLGGGGHGLGPDYAWMAAVSVATLLLVGRRRGAGRLAGAAIVVAYLAYVAWRIAATA